MRPSVAKIFLFRSRHLPAEFKFNITRNPYTSYSPFVVWCLRDKFRTIARGPFVCDICIIFHVLKLGHIIVGILVWVQACKPILVGFKIPNTTFNVKATGLRFVYHVFFMVVFGANNNGISSHQGKVVHNPDGMISHRITTKSLPRKFAQVPATMSYPSPPYTH